jgi:hypothetical protein
LRAVIFGTLYQLWGRIRHGKRYAFKPRWIRRAFKEDVETWKL